MKPKAKLAAALRKVADKIDPPGPVIPLPDVAWNKTGWGNYV